MLKTRLLHPEILEALGEAGHGAQVLIADGNYPLATRSNDAALSRVPQPGARHADRHRRARGARRRHPDRGGARHGPRRRQRALDLRGLPRACSPGIELERLGRFEFYDVARGPDFALAIATGEQRIYANLLLTIGVVMPD